MKTRYKIIGASIGFGLLFWGVDAVLDYLFFYENRSLVSLLITNVPASQIYLRSVVLVHFVIFGLLVAMVISRRHQAQDRVAHLNRVLRAIRNINQLIVREKDRDRLIQDVCGHLIESRGYYSAWIALFDASGKVMMTAQSGLDGKFASLRAQLEGNELPACGRQALAQPAVVVIPDPITFCANCPLAKNYLDRGAMTVRLASEGRIYGLLAVSLPADLAGDSEEQALLHEVASDIAFALQNIELEAARAQAEAALRESEEKFKHLFDHVPIGLSLTLPTGEVDANQAFYEMFGYAQDHAALKWQEVTHPEDVEKSQAVIDALMAGEEDSARFTKRYVHKDGSIVWAEVSTSIRRDAEDAVRYFMTAVQDITERKEAEHALRESEQRFRRIYENIAVGLAQISIDFVIESANKAYCRMLGYSEEELIGKHLREITHPDILEENLRKQALLAAGEIDHYRMEKQFVHKDGHIVYGVLDANLIRDAEDQPLYFIGGVLDITERKEAEERLKESERQYRTLVETISHGIAEVDLAGRMVFLNDAHQRMLGYQPGELVGDYFWEHDPTPGHTKEIRAYFEYLKNEQPDPEPYISQNVCKDGEVIDVLVDWNYKRDEDGVLQGFISVVTDITERKEAEEALRESERRFRIVLENLPGGLFAHDLDGHLLLVNEMSARNTGYSQEELLDMTVADIDPSSVTRDDRAHLWHQLDEGETITLHSTHVRKDGSKYPVEVYLSNITLKGEPIILGVAMDITQRKQAEEALRESEERFRDVFETSPIGIAMVDTATQLFLDANDGLLRILGYSLDELKQLTVMDVTHLEDWAREAEMVRAYLEGSASRYAVAKRFIRKDGEIRWVRITGAVMTGISDGETPVAIANVVDITQRKRAEEALRESERQKDLILNASAEMIAYYDTDLRVIWANRAAAESVDMSPGDLVDMHCYEIWHQRDEPCHECPVLKARDHKAPWQGEQETPDGRYWYTRGYPVFDEAGEVTALVEFGQDITDRKEAEQALRESEKKYRTLFESALNPIFMVDEHSQYIDANPAALAFLECDRETLLEKRVWDFSPPDLLEHQQQEHAPFVGRRTLETDYFVHGEIKTLLLNVVPLKLKGETVLYGVGQDITERKRVEEERARLTAQVREQAQQMEQILATVPTGVLLLDAEWRVLRANPTAKKDLVKLADIEVGDVLTKLGDRPLAELLTSPPTRGLWHEIESDRDTFEVIARSMPASGLAESAEEDSASEQWVLVINDVTREREIRTQLQQQERLAAIGQMAAGIAHDFNNIMAVVVLYAQLGMRTPNLPPKIGDRLQIISQQAKRATDLIEQILDFSRRAMLERRPLDLLPLLKEQVKLLERTLPEHIEIELDYAEDEYTIHADPTRIQQVIMNLAVNARDAMPEGGALRMSLEQITIAPDQAPPLLEMGIGTWVRLAMADTGTGIPSEVLPHIFEPFFTTKGPGEGSGLGLPQVHGIVGLHGGYIDVKTEVGAGTTFIIYLPALTEKPTEVVSMEVAEMPPGHGETILVVEDEDVVRTALVATLEQLDYRVLQASNGQEALTILASQADRISLVLSDFVMPVMGGRRLFAAMQKRGFDLPIVLLSGHPLEEELREMQDQGLADWMLKPPNIEQLAKVLAQVLKGRAG